LTSCIRCRFWNRIGRALPLAMLAVPAPAVAQHREPGAETPSAALAPLSAASKDQARRRFDRGLTLYNAGDLNGALAEFLQAYKLTGHPVVLYNLALVQAGLGKAVEAVEALERLQTPQRQADLGAERAERARQVYEEQRLRVGSLEIRCNVARAQIQLDGIDVARTPSGPLRVTAGAHIVSLSAPQYEPRRVSVTVAGRAPEELQLELTPLEEALAHLMPTSRVPDVEVRANGELVGRTPLATNLAFRPGEYALEFTRAGYVPVRRHVQLDPGSVGQLEVNMVPSEAGLAAGGSLAFSVSEGEAIVQVDGQPRIEPARGLRLPLGRHSLRFQRAGFFDVEREVWVKTGDQRLDVTLLPTPPYLDDYVKRARVQRFWGYVSVGGGAVLAGGSAAFLLWNKGQKRDAERAFNAMADKVAALPNGVCDSNTCANQLDILVDELDARRKRDVYGWVGMSAGALSLGTGIFLLAAGADPRRYDPKPESDVFGRLELDVHGSQLSVRGSF